jgi:hypothetical protein
MEMETESVSIQSIQMKIILDAKFILLCIII